MATEQIAGQYVFMSDLSPQVQSAAIPFRRTSTGGVEVLLITSRRRRKWVFPHGNIKPGFLPEASAAREALEEAGVIGKISRSPIGIYHRTSSRGDRTSDTPVLVFALEVTSEIPVWLEMGERDRKWMSLELALKTVDREQRVLLRGFRKAVRAAWSSPSRKAATSFPPSSYERPLEFRPRNLAARRPQGSVELEFRF